MQPTGVKDLNETANCHRNHLNALHQVAHILSKRAGQREMLVEILQVLEQNMPMSRMTIMLLSADGSELFVEASADSSALLNKGYQRGEGITGRVLQTAEAAIVPCIADEPLFKNRLYARAEHDRQDMSFICVPISLGNEVLGTLSSDFPAGDPAELLEVERVLSITASMVANDVRARREALIEREKLEAENRRLRSALAENTRPDGIIGNSRIMCDVYTRIHQVASSDTTVLIRGESGTGKELVASAIHYNSARREKPLVKVNCAQLSESLFESELFGHEQGAFTGAARRRIGLIEEAQGGTLFFDEIGEFSPAIQVKLLRVLQEREYQRVGSNRVLKADVRVVTATNCDLEKAVEKGDFRQDLYYRIFVFPIHLPPLRDRKDDIPSLTDYFIEKYARKMSKPVRRISTTAIQMMSAYHWPGNVRELENCIEYAVLVCREGVIHGQDLPPTLQMPNDAEVGSPGSLKTRIRILEKDAIIDALKHHNGNVTAAAKSLGLTPRMVRYKIQQMGIETGSHPRKEPS